MHGFGESDSWKLYSIWMVIDSKISLFCFKLLICFVLFLFLDKWHFRWLDERSFSSYFLEIGDYLKFLRLNENWRLYHAVSKSRRDVNCPPTCRISEKFGLSRIPLTMNEAIWRNQYKQKKRDFFCNIF